MAKKSRDALKVQNKNYLAKDFESFKGDLTRFARTYFAKQNADFSDATLGGMFVELASYVGDSMSFFLDYQYNELQPQFAVDTTNVANHAKNAGVKIVGASPSSTELEIFIEVRAVEMEGKYVPDPVSLPILREGTSFNSQSGIVFSLVDDLNFAETGVDGQSLASLTTSSVDASGNPTSFILMRKAVVVSGRFHTETFPVSQARQFMKITLSKRDVSEIISVTDSEGNNYYEVDFLSQNSAFKRTKNLQVDSGEVPSLLQVVNAARRFVVDTNINTKLSTLQFGGGDESLPDNDAIPDPSELALPLYGRTTFTKFAIDPRKLLKTKTLGVAPANTTIKVQYRAGGGQNHNVEAGSINSVNKISINFPKGSSAFVSSRVVNSLDCRNTSPATGGLSAPGINEVRDQISQARNQQSRIVTQDDLLARVYTLPSTFGRVFRASVRKSSRNPLASEMYVVSKDRSGQLIMSPDTLKRNLSTYLNEFRLISDALDILDCTVINYGIEYSIVVLPNANKESVMAQVNAAIGSVATIDQYQIDQPIIEADFINAIINTDGVMSLQKIIFYNLSGNQFERDYSSYTFDVNANMFKGMIVGPPGSIFELKYPGTDIIGSAE